MALSSADLANIRAEIGSVPSDAELQSMYTDLGLGHWLPVAIRVLRTRRVEAISGTTSQISVNGEITIATTQPNLSSLNQIIADLEARWAALNADEPQPVGITTGRLTRNDGIWR